MNTTESKIANVQARISALVMIAYQLRQIEGSVHCRSEAANAEVAMLIKTTGERQIQLREELDVLNAQLAGEIRASKREQADRRPAVKQAIRAMFEMEGHTCRAYTAEDIQSCAALMASNIEEVKSALNQLVRDKILNSRLIARGSMWRTVSVRHWGLTESELKRLMAADKE